MQAIESEIDRCGPAARTYQQLAQAIYVTDAPTRAQLSAVSRAVARLRANGTVEVVSDYPDTRVQLVMSPRAHWLPTVISVLDGASGGLTLEQLTHAVFGEHAPLFESRTILRKACEQLAVQGRAWLTWAAAENDWRVTSVQVSSPPSQI